MALKLPLNPVPVPAIVKSDQPKLIRDLGIENAIKIAQGAMKEKDPATIKACIEANWSKMEKFRTTNLVSFVKSHLSPKGPTGKMFFVGLGDTIKDKVPVGIGPWYVIGDSIQNYRTDGMRASQLGYRPGQQVIDLKSGTGFKLEEAGTGVDVPEAEFYNAIRQAAWGSEAFIEHLKSGVKDYEPIAFEGRVKYVGKNGLPGGIGKFVIQVPGEEKLLVEANYGKRAFGEAYLSGMGDGELAELELAENKPEALDQVYRGKDVLCIGQAGSGEYKWNEWNGKRKLCTNLIALIDRPTDLPPLNIVESEPVGDNPSQPVPASPAPNPQRATRGDAPQTPPPTVGGDVVDTQATLAKMIAQTGLTIGAINAKVIAKCADLKGLIKEEAALVVIAKELGVEPVTVSREEPQKTESPKLEGMGSRTAEKIAEAKRFVEFVIGSQDQSNPQIKNWQFGEDIWGQLAKMEGAPANFANLLPFVEFQKFCAEHRKDAPKIVAPAKPEEPKAEPPKETPAPEAKMEYSQEQLDTLRDKVYECILARDEGNGVELNYIKEQLPNTPLAILGKILTRLIKETAVTKTASGKYQPL